MLTGHPQRHLDVVQVRTDLRVIDQLEVGPRSPRKGETRRLQLIAEEVAFGLIERGQLFYMFRTLSHVIGQRPLQRRHTAEPDKLVDFAHFGGQCGRRDQITGFPARHVIGLAEGTDHEGPLIQLFVSQDAGVLYAVEHQVLVDFIADQIDVAIPNQRGQLVELASGDQGATRVVRRVDDDHARTRAQRRIELFPVDGEITVLELHVHTTTAREFDRGFVTVIARVENDHFIACAHHGLNRAENRVGRARGDRDVGIHVDLTPVGSGDLGRHLLTQRWQAGHRCVLVVAVHGVTAEGFTQCVGPIEIGKTLRKIDRPGFGCKLGHHGKDGGANVRQFAGDHRVFLLHTRLQNGTGTRRIAHTANTKKGAKGAFFEESPLQNQRLSLRFLSAFLWCDIKRRFLLT